MKPLATVVVVLCAAVLLGHAEAAAVKCSAGACCDTKTGLTMAKGTECSARHPCAAAARCDGLSPQCPAARVMSNGTRCTWYSRTHPLYGSHMSDATKLMRATVPAAQISAFVGSATLAGLQAGTPKKWKPCTGVCVSDAAGANSKCVMERHPQSAKQGGDMQCCHTGLDADVMSTKAMPQAASLGGSRKAKIQQLSGDAGGSEQKKDDKIFYCWHEARRR